MGCGCNKNKKSVKKIIKNIKPADNKNVKSASVIKLPEKTISKKVVKK